MKPLVLELRTTGRFEQVMFYDEFFTHYTEEEGNNIFRTQTYDKAGRTKEQCIIAYQEEGFGEANHVTPC